LGVGWGAGVGRESGDDEAAAAGHRRHRRQGDARWGAEQTSGGAGAWRRAKPRRRQPGREEVVAKPREAIAAATDRDTLDRLQDRIAEREREGAITAEDAVALRRALVARLDELHPDATPQTESAEWPETAEVPA